MVLVDEGEVAAAKGHVGLVQPPGHVGDDQADQEQDARLRDVVCQPLHEVRLKRTLKNIEEIISNTCMYTLRRTASKMVQRTMKEMRVRSRSSVL